jgi:hypothetical protein
MCHCSAADSALNNDLVTELVCSAILSKGKRLSNRFRKRYQIVGAEMNQGGGTNGGNLMLLIPNVFPGTAAADETCIHLYGLTGSTKRKKLINDGRGSSEVSLSICALCPLET